MCCDVVRGHPRGASEAVVRSVDEDEHRAVGTAQAACAVDDGPEHEVEIGRRSSDRGQHRVGGDDLFSGVDEIALEPFDRRALDQLGPTAHAHRGLPVTGLSRSPRRRQPPNFPK